MGIIDSSARLFGNHCVSWCCLHDGAMISKGTSSALWLSTTPKPVLLLVFYNGISWLLKRQLYFLSICNCHREGCPHSVACRRANSGSADSLQQWLQQCRGHSWRSCQRGYQH